MITPYLVHFFSHEKLLDKLLQVKKSLINNEALKIKRIGDMNLITSTFKFTGTSTQFDQRGSYTKLLRRS